MPRKCRNKCAKKCSTVKRYKNDLKLLRKSESVEFMTRYILTFSEFRTPPPDQDNFTLIPKFVVSIEHNA